MRDKIIPFSNKKRKTKIDSLVEDAIAIEAEYAKENGKIGYLVSNLIDTTLPHKDPGHLKEWERKNGNQILLIKAGEYQGDDNERHSYGLPYGPKPRLIMSYVCSEVVKTKERKINLGKNLSDFMDKLGFDMTGGKKGTIAPVKEQMKRLFASEIKVFIKEKKKDITITIEKDFKITRERYYWTPLNPEKKAIWESVIVLDEALFTEILEHPVPLHLDVLAALKGSSMELDIYTWLTYRMSYLSGPIEIPWQLLAFQFGSEYAQLRDFKANFLKHLNIVLGFYPAKVREGRLGLLLNPSTTHITKK